MEASVITQDTSHTNPPKEGLDTSSAPPVPQSVLSSHPPSRPSRPKPPPSAVKATQLPSRPPQCPPPPPCIAPPLTPSSKPIKSPISSNPVPLCFNPPAGLPVPLSPTPVVSVAPLLKPLVNTEPSSSCSTPTPPGLTEQLVGSASVWQTSGLNQDKTTSILENETPGAFLVNRTVSGDLTLLVRLCGPQESSCIRSVNIEHHKSFLHLTGSSLLFDDIFKLISFYCASRDILDGPLRLPQAITKATKKEELEAISALGTDFWTSDSHHLSKNQDLKCHSVFLHVDPVLMDRKSDKDLTLTREDTHPPGSVIQNGESPQKTPVKSEIVKTPIQEIKYKRPPPRPPSLGSTSGMGLLFSEKKEEAKGGEERENRKLVSLSSVPLRPPVSLQLRSAPPLPPAPLRCTATQKSSKDQDKVAATESGTEESSVPKGGETEKSEGESVALIEDSAENKTEETKSDGEKVKDTEEEQEVRDPDKAGTTQTSKQPSVKRPTRPVPPPRRKTCPPEVFVSSIQAAKQPNAVSKATPPRRPDVSLYSPEGGAMVDADPDSGTNSSTEEEGELNLDQKHSHTSESRSPKVKRTPTNIILDRARHRLSTVITGLISHERRLSQRIVELARAPSSYFGNLVKEHRAFTLESMPKHTTSTELLQEIRQMMTQLKSYLLQSAELQGMLEPQHQYTPDKLESIVEAALCKSVLKPLRESIYQSLEILHTENGSLKQLAQNQSVVMGSTTTSLGISTAIPEASAMEKINVKLNNLHLEYSPQKKIELLLKACKIIYDSMSVSCPGRPHGADDFLPVMMYVLARSNLSALQLDVEYMMELMDPALTLGEGSYYLTTTYGALEHIRTFDQQRSATRQLSREIQDSIHRWERRRTLNQESAGQRSVQDFLTVCSPEVGSNPKTLGVLPTTTIQQLTEECAARFEQDSYVLSIYVDGVRRPLVQTELALTVKSSCKPGAYCFVFHSADQPTVQHSSRNCPSDPPPHPAERPVQQSIRTRPSKPPPHPARRPSQQSVRSCPTGPPPHPSAQPNLPSIPNCPTAPPPHPSAQPNLPSIPSCPTTPPPESVAQSSRPSIPSCPTAPPPHPAAQSSPPSIPSCPTDQPPLPAAQLSLESITCTPTDQPLHPTSNASHPTVPGPVSATQSNIESDSSCPTDSSPLLPPVSYFQPTSAADSTEPNEDDKSLISF
ncbi:ras and Rab interactor 3 [Synchiropus picturatus]